MREFKVFVEVKIYFGLLGYDIAAYSLKANILESKQPAITRQ
jgi:hypothetical protein